MLKAFLLGWILSAIFITFAGHFAGRKGGGAEMK